MDAKEIIEVEEKNNLGPTKSPAQNGVIITVYVESPRRQSPLRTAALEKSKPKSVPKKLQTARKRGHDRRAQLLAYARELRNGPNGGTSREVQCPRNNSTAKPKKTWKWLTSPASICFRSRRKVERTSSRWRYERIPIEETQRKQIMNRRR
ncbi:hypothetical protein CJ030_MR7G010660 [Morella rubra]|uniref:Uncharacterized protein n=1 Tax=Morella rubra TaxID=262757 RepID=A0A6A1UYE2_9ROSI|nr:hypothetical protein CJ030_MR7G010660 [Morella rubra]